MKQWLKEIKYDLCNLWLWIVVYSNKKVNKQNKNTTPIINTMGSVNIDELENSLYNYEERFY